MPSSDELAANMRKTTEALLNAFDGKWSVEGSLAPRAPECEHIMLPSFLNHPKRNNDEWRAYITKLAPLIEDAKMTMHDYIAAPAERRVVCQTSMEATTVAGPFSNEYVWFLTFDENGGKIIKITEFLGRMPEGRLSEKLKEAGALRDD